MHSGRARPTLHSHSLKTSCSGDEAIKQDWLIAPFSFSFFFYWAYLCQTLHMLNCMIGWSSLCCTSRVHNPHSYVTACKNTHTIIAWVPFDYSILNVAEVVVVGLFLFWGSGIAGVVGGLVRLSCLADGNLGLSLWLVLGWGYKLWRWFD